MRTIFITVLLISLGIANTSAAEKIDTMLVMEKTLYFANQEMTFVGGTLEKHETVFAKDLKTDNLVALYKHSYADTPIGYARPLKFIPYRHEVGDKIPHAKARERKFIKSLQILLNERGCKVGRADGVIGHKTRRGLTRVAAHANVFAPQFTPRYYLSISRVKRYKCSDKMHNDLKRNLSDECKGFYTKAWGRKHGAFFRYRNGCGAAWSYPSKRQTIKRARRECMKWGDRDTCWMVFAR